jgi:hypothetical protein
MAKKPCIYTLKDGRVLSYDEMRSYILEEGITLEKSEEAKTKPKVETKATEETGEKKKPKEVKRTIIGKRAYDEETNEDLREKLKEKGLYRNVKDPSIAMESAKEFVDENGLDATIAILNYDNVIHLDNQVALSGYAMVAAKNKMADAKTPEEYEIAQMKYAEVVHLMDKIGNKIGTELNMFRQVYKMLEHENIAFNTKKLVNEYKTAFKKKFKDLYGDAIPPSIEKQFDDLHEKLKNNQEKLEELNKKIAEKEAHISLLEIQEEAKKESKSTDERKAKAREKLRDGLSEMFGALASLSGGKISAVESDESFTRGARKAIEAIMEETSITFEEAYKKLRQTIIDRGYSADKLDELKENILSEYQANDKTEGTLGLSKKRLKELALEVDMSSGVTPEQQVQQYVDLVRKEIESDYPNITDKEIRDEISGYGKTIKESQDDASKRLSKMKNMLRSVSQLVDISQGVRPLKSGFQRNPTDQDVRSLFKKVREQLKTLPVDPITRDGLLKTAMDAYKRRLTNRIADIQKEIDTRTRIRKEKNVLVDDAETIKLKDALKLKKDEYHQIFGEEIAEEKLEKRNKNREAFLQKKIKEKQAAIDNLIEIEKNTTVKSSAYSKEISILQNELKDLNDIYNSVFKEKILERKIEDLNEKIAKAREKRIERNLETSEEKALRIEREKLEAKRKELTNAQMAAKIVKEEPLTDAEQLALANKKIDATIKSKENKLLKEIAKLEQEIATETREQKIKFPSQPYSKTISDRQKRLKEIKEIHENLFAEEIKERKEQAQLEASKKNIKKRIAELERKIRDKDFAKKPKQKQLMDDEKKKLLIEKENLKEEFDNLLYQHEFENRTIAQKAYDNFVEAPVRLLQTIQTAIDFGLIGVQLSAAISRQAITDPKKLAQNFKNAITAFGSPEFAEQQKNAIKSDSEYETAKEAELSLVGMRNEKTEFQSDLLDLIFKKLVLVMGGDEKLSEILSPKAFERFNQVLGNSIRYDLFKKASVAAKGLGYTIEEDKKVFLDIAGTLNSFTGRASIGNLKALNKTLSLLLFSPKNWASMFKTATPYGLIKFFKMGGNPILENRNFIYDSPAKREAVKSFMSLFAVATTYALLNALRYNNDDDEDTWVNITDPDKADFMKVSERLKGGSIIYTDFFGGRLNMMVTQVKLLQALRGETITTTQGKERDATPFEILENHALNKAAPFPSYVLNMAQYDWDRNETGELVAYSKYSKEPVDLMARTAESFYPMALTDIYQIIQSEPTFLNGLDMIKVSLGVSQVQSKSEQSRRQIKKSNGDIINIPDIDKSIERKLNGL